MGEYKSKHTGLTVDNAVDKIPTENPTVDSVIVLNASGSPSYTALTDLGGSDVTAAGNNTFTGTNIFGPPANGSQIATTVTINSSNGILINSNRTSGCIMEMPGAHLHFTGVVGNASYYGANYTLIQHGGGGGYIRIQPDPSNYRIGIETKSSDNKIGNISIPYNASGTIAFTSDIPNTSSFVKLNAINNFTEINRFQKYITLGDTNPRYSARYDYDNITFVDLATGTGVYKFPSKTSGNYTFAMTDDIKIKSATLSGTTLDITLG